MDLLKSRKEGGHVSFVVGKSPDGKALYMLGGNQNDEVNVSRYDRDVWEGFVVPVGFAVERESLPTYYRRAKQAGRES